MQDSVQHSIGHSGESAPAADVRRRVHCTQRDTAQHRYMFWRTAWHVLRCTHALTAVLLWISERGAWSDVEPVCTAEGSLC